MPMSPALNRRRGIFGSTAPQAPMMAEQAPEKPKFFGEGGTGRTIAGVIGDALAQLGGFDPVFAPEIQLRREMSKALKQREQQRQQELQDWVWKQRYEAANPTPKAPTSFEQILDAAGISGEERIALLRRKAENDANGVPVGVDVQNPDGSITRQYMRPGMMGGGVPQAPVGKLKPYGGPSATPTGGFPR